MMRVLAVLMGVAMASSAGARAQSPQKPDPFAPVAFMLGKWTGTTEGEPGKGTATREYARALNNRFIRITNRSEYPPQEKNPKGEVHHDEGFFSFDRARKRIVLRQFHVEGFFNQYVQEADGSLVFTSEAIENIPAGYKARETYIQIDADHFDEVFELAEPGKPFAVYSRTKFARVN
jgi:hypothetical protein